MPRKEYHWLVWPSLFLGGLGLGSSQLPSLNLSIGRPPAPLAPPAAAPAVPQAAPAPPASQLPSGAGAAAAQSPAGLPTPAVSQATPPPAAVAKPAPAARPGTDSPELHALRQVEREFLSGLSNVVPPPLVSPAPSPTMSQPAMASSDRYDWDKGLDQGWPQGVRLPSLPVRPTPELARYLGYFTSNPDGRSTFALWLRRSGLYRDIFVRTFKRRHLPVELAAVAFIESGLRPAAVSSAGATGLWQFMPATARAYGLAVSPLLDERRSIWRSTEAAAHHLADLYDRLHSWELALAAYNLGYPRLDQAIQQVGSRDFWAVARTAGAIPRETRLYVPKVLAIAVILSNLDYFQFNAVEPMQPLRALPLEVPPGVSLAVIAQASRTTTQQIRLLNPELRGQVVPEVGRKVSVYVPEATYPHARRMLPPLVRESTGRVMDGFGSPYISHRPGLPRPAVKDGLGATWASRSSRQPGMPAGPQTWLDWGRTDEPQALVPPERRGAESWGSWRGAGSVAGIQYQVAKGDSVWSIARSSGVPERHIMKDNRIHHASLIQVGDWLWLRAQPSRRVPSADEPADRQQL